MAHHWNWKNTLKPCKNIFRFLVFGPQVLLPDVVLSIHKLFTLRLSNGSHPLRNKKWNKMKKRKTDNVKNKETTSIRTNGWTPCLIYKMLSILLKNFNIFLNINFPTLYKYFISYYMYIKFISIQFNWVKNDTLYLQANFSKFRS